MIKRISRILCFALTIFMLVSDAALADGSARPASSKEE